MKGRPDPTAYALSPGRAEKSRHDEVWEERKHLWQLWDESAPAPCPHAWGIPQGPRPAPPTLSLPRGPAVWGASACAHLLPWALRHLPPLRPTPSPSSGKRWRPQGNGVPGALAGACSLVCAWALSLLGCAQPSSTVVARNSSFLQLTEERSE